MFSFILSKADFLYTPHKGCSFPSTTGISASPLKSIFISELITYSLINGISAAIINALSFFIDFKVEYIPPIGPISLISSSTNLHISKNSWYKDKLLQEIIISSIKFNLLIILSINLSLSNDKKAFVL